MKFKLRAEFEWSRVPSLQREMFGLLKRLAITPAWQTIELDAVSRTSPRHSSLPRPAVELMAIETLGGGSSVREQREY